MAVRYTKIYGDQIDISVVGLGLSKNVVDDFTHKLDIQVDDSTVEVTSANDLQVKDNGITEAKLNMYNSPSIGQVIKYTVNGMEWSSDTGLTSSSFVFHEIPTGNINSINVTYTLANTPIAGTVQVFLNGLLQAPGVGLDYTISGSTITFVKAPRTNSDLYVHYIK